MLAFWGSHRFSNRLYTADIDIRVFLDFDGGPTSLA